MKKQLWLLAIFSLLLVSFVAAEYRPTFSPGSFFLYGSNFGDVINNILDWFEENPGWIDAIVMLVIFLVLGKNVFGEYFKSKALYITMAIALTIGVLLWERQTGYSLILNSGPAGLVILLVAMFMFIFFLIRHATGGGYVAFAVTYAIFYYYLVYLTNYTPETFPDWFYTITDYLMFDWGWLLTLILFGIIILAIIHIGKMVFGKTKEEGK